VIQSLLDVTRQQSQTLQVLIFALGLAICGVAFLFITETWRNFRQWARTRRVRREQADLVSTRALMEVEKRALQSVAEWKRPR
jgi:hypothetical protein